MTLSCQSDSRATNRKTGGDVEKRKSGESGVIYIVSNGSLSSQNAKIRPILLSIFREIKGELHNIFLIKLTSISSRSVSKVGKVTAKEAV